MYMYNMYFHVIYYGLIVLNFALNFFWEGYRYMYIYMYIYAIVSEWLELHVLASIKNY